MQRQKRQPLDHSNAPPMVEDRVPSGGVIIELDERSAQKLDELDKQLAGFTTGSIVRYDEETARRLDELDKQLADWKLQESEDAALTPLLESAEQTLQWYMEWFESEGRQTNKRSRLGRPFKAQFNPRRNGKR